MQGDLKSRLKKLQDDSGINNRIFLWLIPGKTADQMEAQWRHDHPGLRDRKKPVHVFCWGSYIAGA